jgi:hypothetical protein
MRRRERSLGLLLGTSALALVAVVGCQLKDDANCGGYCGPGTDCIDARCVVEELEQAETGEVEEADGKRKRRKGRRNRRGKGGADAGPDEGALEAGDELPPFVAVDDSNIPQFKGGTDQTIDMKGGSERLKDRVVDQHLRRLENRFQKCLETAARYSDTYVGGGNIKYQFRIEGSGKVSSVTAKAPAKLEVFGIIPCVRKAIYTHKFPSFDGPSMVVESSFRVD